MENKIVFLSVGSRGDIQPLVAMAKELKLLGADILFCTHKEYAALPKNHGLNFAEIPRNPTKGWMQSNKGNEKSKSLWEQIEPDAKAWLDAGLKHTVNADAIVYNALYIVGQHLGEKLKIPYFPVIFEPNLPTKDFPIAYFPIQNSMGALLNKMTYYLGPIIFWLMIRKKMNLFRKNELNLPPISWKGPIHKLIRDKNHVLCCYSKYLSPKASDWDDNINVPGYCFLDNLNEYETYPELETFLSDKKPVFIDLGSFSSERILPKVKIILSDLDETEENILIAPGKLNTDKLNLPENCFVLPREVPHQWLLPKVKMIISHGGVGVVHAGLRAGIPNITVTIFAAQYFWAYKLFKKNLGSMPIRLKKLKKGDIKNAVTYINGNSIITNQLNDISKLIQNENGAKSAAEIILKNI